MASTCDSNSLHPSHVHPIQSVPCAGANNQGAHTHTHTHMPASVHVEPINRMYNLRIEQRCLRDTHGLFGSSTNKRWWGCLETPYYPEGAGS
eukprot:1111542-Prorocentrum_minimum.AAC.1